MTAVDVVIVGYGNTLRSDDGFGPTVADMLRSNLADRRVRVLSRQLLTVELVADLEHAGLCILIDAATSGTRGELSVREIASEFTELGTLGHDLSAASLVGLTQQLTGRSPRCMLCSIVPESMELGEGLTPSVAALANCAVDAVLNLVERYFAERSLAAER